MAVFRSRSRSATARSTSRRPGSPLRAAPPPRPFLAAIEDLNRGEVPSNEQLKSWMRYMEASLAVPSGELSPAGRALVRDLQELFSVLRTAIDSKNSDGLLQRFFTHARLAAKLAVRGMTRSGRIQIVDEPRRKVYLFGAKDAAVGEEARIQRREAMKEVRALYRLIQLMIASPEMRKAVAQLQDIAAIVIPQGISRGRQVGAGVGVEEEPRREAKGVSFAESSSYERGGESAAYGQRRESRTQASSMSPTDLDASIQRLRTEVRQTESSLSELEGNPLGSNPGPSSSSNQRLGSNPSSSNLGGASLEHTETTTAEGDWLYMSSGKKSSESYPKQASTKGKQAQPGPLSQSHSGIRRLETELPEISEEETQRLPILEPYQREEEQEYPTKERRYEEEQRVPEATGALSDAHKNEVIFKLRELLKAVSGNAELRKALSDAFTYATSLQAIGQRGIPTELQYEENIKAAQRDLLEILERFSGANVGRIGPQLALIQAQMANDYELKDFFGDWQSFLRRCSKDSAYIDTEEWEHRAHFLLDRSQTIGQEKYAGPFNELIGSVQDFLEGWKSDRITGKIGAILQRILRKDILGQQGTESRGTLLLSLMRPDLLQDFRSVILPSMLRNLHEIPLPRIESITDGDRLVLENVVIPAGGFMPDDLDVRQSSSLRMSPRERWSSMRSKVKRARSGWRNTVRIRMDGMRTELRDVRFEVDKTRGFPKLHDDGLADLRFAGKGLSITMNLASATGSDPTSSASASRTRSYFGRPSTKTAKMMLEPQFVRVKIDRLILSMHDTRRDWMYKLMSPFIAGRVKRAIETSIRDQIVSSLRTLDSLSRGVSTSLFASQ